jgi:general stress protein 26
VSRITSFAEIAEEFERRWRRTIWATMATVAPSGRLQSRLVHPLWEGTTGWITTGAGSLKARHLKSNPYASLTYWDQTNEQVHLECRAEFEERPDEKRRVWNLFKNTPFPIGYDPAAFFQEGPEDASVGIRRLLPWRVELWSLPISCPARRPGCGRHDARRSRRARL